MSSIASDGRSTSQPCLLRLLVTCLLAGPHTAAPLIVLGSESPADHEEIVLGHVGRDPQAILPVRRGNRNTHTHASQTLSICIHAYIPTKPHTYGRMYVHNSVQTEQTDKQTDGQTDGQPDGQTQTQTRTHTHTQRHIYVNYHDYYCYLR